MEGVFFPGGELPEYWSESHEPQHDGCHQQILLRHERPKQCPPEIHFDHSSPTDRTRSAAGD
jgi:hypothetical protein